MVIPQLYLAPGKTIWYRSYLVVNRRDRAIAQAQSLVDQVDYGLLTFDPATTPRVPVAIHRGKVVKPQWLAKPAFELFAQPVPGSRPLFLVANATTGQEVVTTDPYLFVPREKLDFDVPPEHPQHDYYRDAVGYSLDENNTRWERLLGYGYVDPPPGDDTYRPLSELLDRSLFPETTIHHRDLWVKPAR